MFFRRHSGGSDKLLDLSGTRNYYVKYVIRVCMTMLKTHLFSSCLQLLVTVVL